MTVHTFEVRHIKEGLEQIKAELGASAVILGTKRRDDGTLEISAKGEKQLPPPRTEETQPADLPPQIIEHPALTHHIQSLQQSIHDLVSQVQGLESEVRHMRLGQELQPAPAAPHATGKFPQVAGLKTAQREFRLGLEALRGSSENQGLLDGLFSLQRALAHRGVTESNIEEIMAHVLAHCDLGTSLFDLALEHIKQWIEIDVPLWSTLELPHPRAQVHAMIGPTGVGKTTMVAKVAAYAQWAKDKRVGIVCADDFRIGGRYQLETYARLIEIPMVTVKDLGQMRTALDGLAECDLIFVDTNALDLHPTDAGPRPLDAGALTCLRPEYDLRLHLVLSSTSPATEQCRCVSALSDLELSSLIFTKLDEASHSLGSILSTTRATGLPISALSDGRAVPQDLLRPTPKQLAAWILQGFRGRGRIDTSDDILEARP